MRATVCTLIVASGLVLTGCGSAGTSSADASPAQRSEASAPPVPSPKTPAPTPSENAGTSAPVPSPSHTDASVEATAAAELALENLPPDFPSEVPLLGQVAPESIGTDLTHKYSETQWIVSMRSTETDEELNKELAAQLLLDAGFTKLPNGDFSNGHYDVGFFVMRSLLTYGVRAS